MQSANFPGRVVDSSALFLRAVSLAALAASLALCAVNGFIGIINDAFGWIGVNLGYIGEVGLPRLAQGGIVSSTTIAMIGEEGKEAVIPLENNTDNWAGTLASILTDKMEMDGSSGKTEIVVNMTNQINNDMDAADIGRKLMQSIRRAA